MGNNRMVVNRDGTVEQKTHYYPYGPRRHRESIFMLSARRRGFSRGKVIGDISTNESLQKYKFEGKELDRTFGLDTYDVHARQYFAMAPMWDRVDPLAEKYYGISLYVYCGGDPVNRGDYDGMSLQLKGDSASLSSAESELLKIGGKDCTITISDEGVVSGSNIDKTTAGGERLAQILEDSKTTTVNLTHDNSVIFIGEAASATIDMTDVVALGDGGSLNSSSAFLHELNEQYQMQSSGKTVNRAHNDSRQLEINMNTGPLGGKITESNFTPNGNYTITLEYNGKKYQTTILHNNGTIFQVKKSCTPIKL